MALLAAGCADASLPDNTQLANWLRNNSRKNKDALDKDKSVVAAVALEVSQLPRSLPKQIDALFLLRDPIITDTEVCILFASPGTLNTFDRYTGLDVALSVDTKMKVLTRGMGVATVSLLVKDQLRKTRLPKLGKGSRTQSRAWTSHGMPVAQAIFTPKQSPTIAAFFGPVATCGQNASRAACLCPSSEAFKSTRTFTPAPKKLVEKSSHTLGHVMIFPFQRKISHGHAVQVPSGCSSQRKTCEKAFALCLDCGVAAAVHPDIASV